MRVIVLVFVLLCASGCGSLIPRFPSLTPPERPQTIYSWTERETITPPAFATADAPKIEREIAVNFEKSEKSLSWFGRVRAATGAVMFYTIFGLIIFLIIAPGTAIPFLFKKYQEYKKALQQTVKSIKEFDSPDKEKLKSILAEKQDTDAKIIVNKLRAEA